MNCTVGLPLQSLESPLQSLEHGRWVKLICGASFQDLPALRSLAIAYGIVGVDCIDMAADLAVVTAVQEGLMVAQKLLKEPNNHGLKEDWIKTKKGKPWLMISLNDGEDPHFRKAYFEASRCPTDCPRPCEKICPAQAINSQGIIDQRCYGCGRCLPVCPLHLISTHSHQATLETIANLLNSRQIDALEIHTQVCHETQFKQLWLSLLPHISTLKLLAISCPEQAGVLEYLHFLNQLIQPLPCPLLWQTDGRPMSGDIGKGTTHAAIRLAQKVLNSDLPGYVQLAGGTNAYTVNKLRELSLLAPNNLNSDYWAIANKQKTIAGIAYGSYARALLMPILSQLESNQPLENAPDLLQQAVAIASQLSSWF